MAWIAGTPVTITTTDVKQQLTSTALYVKAVRISHHWDNTHKVYIGDSTLDPTTTPPTGVSGWLPAPPWASSQAPYVEEQETSAANGIAANSLYVAGTSGEVVLWSYLRH